MDIIRRRHYQIYSFVLIVFIVRATGSDSNETTHEHRQSRVTGRIVKLYSGTRPEPILCAGEGFQADPHNCAVFYRCMKSGNGKYTVFKFQCGPGTVYDPETEVCNHPRSTKRSECGGLLPAQDVDRLNINEIEGTQDEIPSPITNQPTYTIKPQFIEITTKAQAKVTTLKPWVASSSTVNTSTKRHSSEFSTVFTTLNPWGLSTINPLYSQQYTPTQKQQLKVTSRPTTSVIPQSNTGDNICTSDGFMGDTENCRKFYRCVASQRGTYTRYEFMCSESTVWDDASQSCNHAWAVKRSRCGRSNQDGQNISPTPVYPSSNQNEYSVDKTVQQQLQISYGSKVTQTQTQISNGSVIQNQTQINYGDRITQNKNTEAKQNQTQISHGSAVSQIQTQIDYNNKGVQTQLQIDHSEQSSQTQIQVHGSTTLESLTSTISSTSHASTHDNKCKQSGFMGDANDCKKFYRCIDNGRGGYTKFEFSCGEGTVWDQSIEACNHAWAVKECGGNIPTETTSTHAPISISKSTQNHYTTITTKKYDTTSEPVATDDNEDNGYGHQNQGSTATSTISRPSTTKLPPSMECQSSGFIGDANDCKVFYRCVENGRGSFTKYEFKCGEGTVWDTNLEACNHAWAVKNCGGNASSDVNKIETTTEKQNIASQSPSTIIIQSTTEPAATKNDDYYDTGYGSANNDFSSTTTTTTTTKKPQAIDHGKDKSCQSSGFMGDKNNCKKFYRCVDNGNGGYTRYEFTCGEGTVWDPKIEACNHAWAVEKCGDSGSTVVHPDSTFQPKPTNNYEFVSSSSTEGYQITDSPITVTSTSTSTTPVFVSMGSTCTRSGFMGDQNDCKKFYRCVDNGRGSYTKYEFTCGEGTVWDQKIEACNHAWAVEKCGESAEASIDHQESTTQHHPIMSDETDIGYPSMIDSGSDTTSQKTTTYSTTERYKETSDSNNCIDSGFIGDKNDCKKFYRCVDDGKGSFIRYEFSCGEGTLWDQSIEACNHAWAVKDCGKTENNTMHTSSENPIQVTLTSESEDQGYPQFTEKTSTSTISNYPDINVSEMCSTEGFIGDKKDCKKFYRCVDNGRGGFTKYEFMCGEGTYWNQEILSCDHATSDKTCGGKGNSSSTHFPQHEHDEIYTETTSMTSSSMAQNVNDNITPKPQISSGVCTSEGFYGNQNNCKMFYRCVDNGKGSYTKYDFTCGEGTVWDQEIQACNHESNNKNCSITRPPIISQTTENQAEYENGISLTTASESQYSTEKTQTSSTSGAYQCTSEGFFADPNDCKKFIRCVSNDKGGYTKYDFVCGEGTIWVQDILACDHNTDDLTCSSQTTSKPVTTEGHKQTTEKYEPSTSTSQTETTVKQDENNNGYSDRPSHSGTAGCSSEGFYGNENDCRQFYRCVDNGKGSYTKYDFTCGDGTAWDSSIQACNHIDQVKTCKEASENHPIMHEEESQPTVTSSTMKTTTSESSHDISSGNKNTCESEGYFGDTQDCKKFYRCVDNGKGGYTKYDYTCGEGTIWDQDITTCNHPQDVANPSCIQNQGGSTTTVSSSPSESTSTSYTTATSSLTSDSSASSQTTTTTTEKSASNCSQEETSRKPVNQNITCNKAGYYANPNDCKKFYRCVDWDGDGKKYSVYHFECGEGTIWDPAVETCNHKDSVYPPRDCSGSQSQSENQSPATEETTTTEQLSSSSQGSTTTQKSSTTQSTAGSTVQQTTTQQSTSEQTTTQESTTPQQTTTQQSTSSEQTTTQQSTISELTTTQQSTTSEQTTTQQSITSEETTTQQSTTSELTTAQQSTTSEQTPAPQTTTTEQTTTQQSTSEQTTTQQSTTSEQTTTQQPLTSEETTQQSTTEQSTATEPTTTEQSATSVSTTEQSSSTTESSTTEQTTTQSSTTTEKSEQSTTEESTTDQSTTQISESSTTESSTNENTTDKNCPETNQDQNLFICPTSFKRHPKYCNLFYQCDEDDNTHDIKIAVFNCPNNTIYDESQTRCVEENKADKKCNGKIAQKRRFKRLDKDYKEPIVVTKDSFACSSAGYFSFEKDSECSPAFLKCKTDKRNTLRGVVYQCPTGYVYWSISKRCEPINRVRDCKRSQNNWVGRWEIPVERRNVAPSS